MQRDWKRALPESVTSSMYFSDLSENEVSNFRAWLAYVEEIHERVAEWLKPSASKRDGHAPDLRAFLPALELDVAINLAPGHKPEVRLSSWLMHTNLAPDGYGVKSHRFLSREILGVINAQGPTLESGKDKFIDWLRLHNMTLAQAIDGFFNSKSFEAAYTHLLAVDLMLSNIYVGLLIARLASFWEF